MWPHSGGRRTARNSNNAADLHGRVRENTFDLPAEVPPYRPSAHEAAADAFRQLPAAERESLTSWANANLSRAVAIAPYDGGPLQNVLKASTLAQQASLGLNRTVTAAQIAGGLLALGFKTIRSGDSPAGLQFAANWKGS